MSVLVYRKQIKPGSILPIAPQGPLVACPAKNPTRAGRCANAMANLAQNSGFSSERSYLPKLSVLGQDDCAIGTASFFQLEHLSI